MQRGLVLAGALLLGIGLAMFLGLRHTVDYSTPRSAALTFYVALITDDLPTARASVCDSTQAELMDDLRGMIQSVLTARDAAIARFGDMGQGVSGGLPSLDDLAAADEHVEGNSAALHCIDPSTLSLRLKRSAEQWKVDLFATFSLSTSDHAMARRMMQLAGVSIAEHAKSIQDGKYGTAHEANTALKTALAQAAVNAKIGQLFGR